VNPAAQPGAGSKGDSNLRSESRGGTVLEQKVNGLRNREENRDEECVVDPSETQA
jgi:hypothetical protein